MKSKIICNFKTPNIMLSQEYNNIQTEICPRGGDVQRLINKNFISNLINNKDYEITSRNTSLSWSFEVGGL